MQRTERLADLGRVAAGLAHELRNPLASMSGSLELLRAAAPAAEDDRRLMDIVLRESERLNELISEFLRFARPPPLRRAPADLAVLLAETLEVFRHDPGAAGVTLEEDLGPAPADCDPAQVRQVAWNLLLERGPGAGAARGAAGGSASTCRAEGAEAVLVGRGRRPGDRRVGARAHLPALPHHQGARHRARARDRAPDRGRARWPRRRSSRGPGRGRASSSGCRRRLRPRRRPVRRQGRVRARETMARILVVDDEPSMREFLEILLEAGSRGVRGGRPGQRAGARRRGRSRPRHHRPAARCPHRPRAAPGGEGARARHRGDHRHRLRDHRERHPGHEARGLRLRAEAVQGGRAEARDRQGARAPVAGGREPGAAATGSAAARRRPRSSAAPPPCRRSAGWSRRWRAPRPPCSSRARAAPARRWWRGPSTSAAGGARRSWPSTAAPSPRGSSRASCSATSAAPSPARSRRSPGSSRWRGAGPSSSTRWASCRPPSR